MSGIAFHKSMKMETQRERERESKKIFSIELLVNSILNFRAIFLDKNILPGLINFSNLLVTNPCNLNLTLWNLQLLNSAIFKLATLKLWNLRDLIHFTIHEGLRNSV